MVRSISEFIVVEPEKPGDEGPVMAMAPSIFEEDPLARDHLVQLPPNVGNVQLYRGVVLKGLGTLFKKTGAEVMPIGLEIVRMPGEEPRVSSLYYGGSEWD